MLSYQHGYHAGNLADVHKHAALAAVLDYLIQKDKPLSYIETHAGRGVYDLTAAEALKTGEAEAGILKMAAHGDIPKDHPYGRCLANIRAQYGDDIYPGSPLVATEMLRSGDTVHLAEKHPQEYAALQNNMPMKNVHVYAADGYETARGLLPPMPRRGIMLIDPSYEIKDEYIQAAQEVIFYHKKWPVGIIMLWYPVLSSDRHSPMINMLKSHNFADALHHEIHFPAAHKGHRLTGSGLFMVNPPYVMSDKFAEIDGWFAKN